jgi:ferredoxin-thioredoxin reductase catalytic chain
MTYAHTPSPDEIEAVYQRLDREAQASGYHLNTDAAFARELVAGLLTNAARYGYRACPCRLASGDKNDDLDIICPCDYRDVDVAERGACYCALYISAAVAAGDRPLAPIPERRPPPDQRRAAKTVAAAAAPAPSPSSLPLPVWRCGVCGYLCAREGPPDLCPICKAAKERFQRFM